LLSEIGIKNNNYHNYSNNFNCESSISVGENISFFNY